MTNTYTTPCLLGTSHTVFHLPLKITSEGGSYYYYYSHLQDKEIEAQRG